MATRAIAVLLRRLPEIAAQGLEPDAEASAAKVFGAVGDELVAILELPHEPASKLDLVMAVRTGDTNHAPSSVAFPHGQDVHVIEKIA